MVKKLHKLPDFTAQVFRRKKEFSPSKKNATNKRDRPGKISHSKNLSFSCQGLVLYMQKQTQSGPLALAALWLNLLPIKSHVTIGPYQFIFIFDVINMLSSIN